MGSLLFCDHFIFSLGEKFADEKVVEEYAREFFTAHIFSVMNTLVGSYLGWQEISVEELRYTASSRILVSIDQIGFIYLDNREESDRVCTSHNKTFEPCEAHGMSVQLAKMPTSQIRSDTCFAFHDDEICVPSSVFDENQENCTTLVASFVKFENGTGILLHCIIFAQNNYKSRRTVSSLLCV